MTAALLDTNVLVHAANVSASLHAQAARLVERGLRTAGVFCVAPQNLVEFAAVVTRPRFVQKPLPAAELTRIVGVLYQSRRLAKIYPRRGTVIRAVQEGASMGVSGPTWYDLFLALTMRDAGVRTVITDNLDDFRLFPFVTARPITEA